MGKLSPIVQPLAIWTGYICMLQALSWGVLDILAIIGWAECQPWDADSVFLSSLQEIYFKHPEVCTISISSFPWYEFIMSPYDILAWLIIMLVFNTMWFFASVGLIMGWDHRLLKYSKWLTILWCIVTAGVCVIDLVACAMFGADYGTIYKMHETTDPTYLAPSAVMMTLSIRGFTLWVFNFVTLIYFVSKLRSISKHCETLQRHSNEQSIPLDLYGPPAPTFGVFNDGYKSDHDYHTNHSQPALHRKSRSAEQLASGYPRTAPNQHIPRPDYSPPADVRHHSSRGHSLQHQQPQHQMRSALKNSESVSPILSMYGEY